MKKPADIVQLIEDLKDEVHDSSVGTDKSSKAVIHLDPEDEKGFTLSGAECKLLLHSERTVGQLCDALDNPEEVSISLHSLDLTQEVQDALERSFMAVDEL